MKFKQTKPSVKLLYHTPLSVCSNAIRTCWDSHKKGGCYNESTDKIIEKDRELINRVGNKYKHSSTLEHLTYNFFISNISRACLQELARHRMANLSVKSTRYTLKELKNEEPFIECWAEGDIFEDVEWYKNGYERASKYIILTGNFDVDLMSIQALDNLRILLNKNISNDLSKFALVESYKTELTWTVNARSLQNFLQLRTSKSALWEIRNLAFEIFKQIPEDHKYLFEDFINSEV